MKFAVFLCVAVAMCSAVSPPRQLGQRLEMGRIEGQLRRELGTGLPKMSHSASRPTKEALDLMMGQSVEKTERKPKTDTKSMILPAGGSSDCKRRNDSTCTRFEYNVSPDVIPSTARLMVHESGFLTIWAFCLNSSRNGISAQGVLERTTKEAENGWFSYSFPVLQNSTFWKDSTKCGIEISGQFNGSNPPVLLVQEKEHHSRLRKRQAEEASPCQLISFNVTFSEIGMDNLIVYPTGFEARFCSGMCQGEARLYEIVMEQVFRNDRTIKDSHSRCWATCCRPAEYESLDSILFIQDKDAFESRTLPNMIVKSCSCS